MKVKGVWIPLVTPFLNGEIDFLSYKRLIEYYMTFNIDGFIPVGTTGEAPTINEYEFETIIEKTMQYTKGNIPVIAGLGGNDTHKVSKMVRILEKTGVQGILSVSPYYSKPDQRGIYEHFKKISESTSLDILLYNIPSRTGSNMENETVYKLAELKNIVGIKDCSGNIKQTLSLLEEPPKDFSIMTGDDSLFYTTLAHGGQGGILASAHLYTESFIKIYDFIQANKHLEALNVWKELASFIPLLFSEPNPSPVKYCLNILGLIDSAEVRLPLVEISLGLENKINPYLFKQSKLVSA